MPAEDRRLRETLISDDLAYHVGVVGVIFRAPRPLSFLLALGAVAIGCVVKPPAKPLPVHEAQLVTYLKLTGKPVGLLLNFNVPVMKDGIIRKINT